MEVKIAKNKEEWGQEAGNFAQSWGWGEVLRSEGKEVERLVISDENGVLAKAQVVYQNLPFGWKYAFCPRGPAAMYQVPTIWSGSRACLGISSIKYQGVIETLSEYLKEKGCMFLRFEPAVVPEILNTKYQILNIKDINPRATLILDLTKSEEELLAGMHQKTRYNIHLAEKKDLVINDKKDFDSFIALSTATAKRDGFRLHDAEHYRRVLESNISYELQVIPRERDPVRGISCEKPIATAVFIGSGDTFTYLYGASDYSERDKMAPYLLQWEGIKLGKKLGYKYYDFFGVAPRCPLLTKEGVGGGLRPLRPFGTPPLRKGRTDGDPSRGAQDDSYQYDPKHQYAGVTRFKLGFGGKYREDPGTFDLIIDKNKYKFYSTLRFIRRLV